MALEAFEYSAAVQDELFFWRITDALAELARERNAGPWVDTFRGAPEAQTSAVLEVIRALAVHSGSAGVRGAIDLAVSLRASNPRLQAYRTLSDDAWSTAGASVEGVGSAGREVCEAGGGGAYSKASDLPPCSWVHYRGRAYTTAAALERDVRGGCAAQKRGGGDGADVFTFDHVHPSSKSLHVDTAETAILYGTPLGDGQGNAFAELHQTLESLAEDGRVRYVLRPHAPSNASLACVAQEEADANLLLQGYGVELAIKSMEYTTIDEKGGDRRGDGPRSISDPGGEDTQTNACDWGPDFAELLGPGVRIEDAVASMPEADTEYVDFGVKATTRILAAREPLRLARDISHNLPFVAAAISATDLEDPRENVSAAPPVPESIILNGGLALNLDRSGNLYSLLSLLTSEVNTHAELTGRLGLPSTLASGLMRKMLLHSASSSGRAARVDTRAEGLTVWVNDLENDAMYRTWSDQLIALRRASLAELQSLQLKLNLVHVQILMDPSASGLSALRAMASLFQVVRTGYAARFGLLFFSVEAMGKMKTLGGKDPSFFEESWSEWEKVGCRALVREGEDFGLAADPSLQFAAFVAFFQDQTTLKRGSNAIGDKGEMTFISVCIEVLSRSLQVERRSPDALLTVGDVQESFITAYTSIFRNTDSAEAKKTMAGILDGAKYKCRAAAASYFATRIGFIADDFPLIAVNGAITDKGLDHFSFYVGYLLLAEYQRLQSMAKKDELAILSRDGGAETVADGVWRSFTPLQRYSKLVFEGGTDSDDGNSDASTVEQAAEKAAQEEARASAFVSLGRELSGKNPAQGVEYLHSENLISNESTPEMTIFLCVDANALGGRDLLSAAIRFATRKADAANPGATPPFRTRLAVLQNPGPRSTFSQALDEALVACMGKPSALDFDALDLKRAVIDPSVEARLRPQQALCVGSLGLKPGENAVVANGRVVRLGSAGPTAISFGADDFDVFARYEYSLRAKPVMDYISGWVSQEAKSSTSSPPPAHGTFDGHFNHLSAIVSIIASRNARAVNHKLVSGIRSNRGSSKKKAMFGPIQSAGEGTLSIEAVLDPVGPSAQTVLPLLELLHGAFNASTTVWLTPNRPLNAVALRNYFRYVAAWNTFSSPFGNSPAATFSNFPTELGQTLTMNVKAPDDWLIESTRVVPNVDLDNIRLEKIVDTDAGIVATYRIEALVVTGKALDVSKSVHVSSDMRNYELPPQGMQLTMQRGLLPRVDTVVMHNYGYFQLKSRMPGVHSISVKEGRSRDIYLIVAALDSDNKVVSNRDGERADEFAAIGGATAQIAVIDFTSQSIRLQVVRRLGMEEANVLDSSPLPVVSAGGLLGMWDALPKFMGLGHRRVSAPTAAIASLEENAGYADDGSYGPEFLHVFSIASGHLYERFLKIMIQSVLKNTERPVKFWFIKNYLSPGFLDFVPKMADRYAFKYEFVTYAWPDWLRKQTEKQRLIWAYKILFLDVIFPLQLEKVIYIDADQIVRGDLAEVWDMDLEGAPYAYTPLCYPPIENPDTWGYRFWEQGFWKSHLSAINKPYHISAFYVVDLKRFRETGAGDTLRSIYQHLSADPNSLANLDQDLPNYAQDSVPIFSLPSEWLWCESWCNEDSKAKAKTIDLCNNPHTKEPKLVGARRIVAEWPTYDKTAEELELEISGYKSS